MGEHGPGLRIVARVLIRSAAGELLLCRNRSGKAWVPPGGTMEPSESLTAAALREAAEEAGLDVEVGRMVYLQEFRPSRGDQQVVEVAFEARALSEGPGPAWGATPAGPPDRPWAAWLLQDLDGPRREVRWFSREAVAALAEPVYPEFLRREYWEGRRDPYLGLVRES